MSCPWMFKDVGLNLKAVDFTPADRIHHHHPIFLDVQGHVSLLYPDHNSGMTFTNTYIYELLPSKQ